MRNFTIAIVTATSMLMGGAAFAQTSQMNNDSTMQGDTSSSTNGNITPSTAVQKNRSSATDSGTDMSSPAAGAPGVAGPSGSKNGPAAK